MDLQTAIDAHVQWRVKLKAAIASKEQLDAAGIGVDHKCELGKWLGGEGKSKYGTKAEFLKLVASHRQFHQVAGRVAAAVNSGKIAEAESLLKGQFQSQSQETVMAIQACKKTCC